MSRLVTRGIDLYTVGELAGLDGTGSADMPRAERLPAGGGRTVWFPSRVTCGKPVGNVLRESHVSRDPCTVSGLPFVLLTRSSYHAGSDVTDLEQDVRETSSARLARVVRWVASVCGVGYVPVVSGTFGSLPGLAIAILFFRWPWVLAVLVAAGIPIAMWAANHAEREGQEKDPRWVVVDETVGMMVALTFVRGPWIIWPAGFVLFRLFDIVKPYPVGRAERLPGGAGIVMDDVLAGLYTNLILRILLAGYATTVAASAWCG